MRHKPVTLAVSAALCLAVAGHGKAADPGATEIGGTMFFDVTNVDQAWNDTGDTDQSGTGTDVKRFYLTVDHQFDDTWSANLTTDFNYSSSDGQTSLFVKKAYAQGRFSDAAVLRIGAADLPWVSFVDKASGHRYIEKSLVDRTKFGTSADWGLHLGGKLGSGAVDYAVSMVNGNGYKDPSRSDGVDFEARVAFAPADNIVLAVGGYSGTLGEDTATDPALHTATRVNAMAAYVSKKLRFGAEYFRASDWDTVMAPVSDQADGWSTWASGQLTDTVSVFGRYDRARLSRDLDPAARETYHHLGVAWKVASGFDLALAWKNTTRDKTATNAAGEDYTRSLHTREIGVWGQLKF